jgi:hypothetical protein
MGTADARLLLRKPEFQRRPCTGDQQDYDVVFRGRRIGRIWEHDYTGAVSGPMANYLWHWYWRDVEGRKDAEGHAPTLQATMAGFRRAWDAPGANVRNITS